MQGGDRAEVGVGDFILAELMRQFVNGGRWPPLDFYESSAEQRNSCAVITDLEARSLAWFEDLLCQANRRPVVPDWEKKVLPCTFQAKTISANRSVRGQDDPIVSWLDTLASV